MPLLPFHWDFFQAGTFSSFKLNIVLLTWILQGNLIYSGANILSIFYSFPPTSFIGVMIKTRFHLPFREESWDQSKCHRSKLGFKVWKVFVKIRTKQKEKDTICSFVVFYWWVFLTVSPISKYVFYLWKKKHFQIKIYLHFIRYVEARWPHG